MEFLEREILEPSKNVPVLVDFWAPWCGPCRVLGPVLDKLAAEANGRWKLVKVNTDEHPEIAQRYRIQSIPAVKLFDQGRVAAEFVGALPESQVRIWLEKFVPREATRAVAAAKAALAQGRRIEALKEARAALAADPGQTEARALVAALTLLDEHAEALELAESVSEGDPGADLAQAVRTLAQLWDVQPTAAEAEGAAGQAWEKYRQGITAFKNRRFTEAVEAWIASMKLSRKPDDDGARRACVALFRWLGEDHEVTLEHRRAFASALY